LYTIGELGEGIVILGNQFDLVKQKVLSAAEPVHENAESTSVVSTSFSKSKVCKRYLHSSPVVIEDVVVDVL